MTDCDHEYTLDSIENPTGAKGQGVVRTIWMLCTLCAHRQSSLTNRSDDEIYAEIAAHTA